MSKLSVNELTDEQGSGAPSFPNGMSVTGADLTDPEITGGIFLGGTGSANKLDDYEEGTFNLVLTIGGSTGSTALGGVSSGTYVKIGRLVFCTMRLAVSSLDTSLSGNVAMEGLPFPATNNLDGDGVAGACFRRIRGVSFSGQLIAGTGFGSTSVTFFSLGTNGNDAVITETDIDNGFSFEGSITYYTDP